MYIPLDVSLLKAIAAVVAGVLSLVSPKLTPYAVGVYLIVFGVISLMAHL